MNRIRNIPFMQFAFTNFSRVECPTKKLGFSFIGLRINKVAAVNRLTRSRAYLSTNHPGGVVTPQIQHHVSETKIGQHTPFTDQLLQMSTVVLREVSMLTK